MTYHRWVLHDCVPDYLLIGWLALPSLEGTGHGIYSAHCIWLCQCPAVEPRTSTVTSQNSGGAA